MQFVRVLSTALPAAAVALAITFCLPARGQDITSNLRGHWKLDDTSGSTAVDSSGQGANGTYTGSMQKGKSGRVGTAVGFSDNGGTTDRISLPYTVLNGQTNITLSFWLRTTNTSYHAILSANNSGNDNEFLVFIESGQLKVRYHNGSNSNVWNLNSPYNGSWHHYVVIANHSSDTTTVYQDGNSLGTQGLNPGSSFTVSSGGLFLAQDQDCVGGCFDSSQRLIGDLDQVRIYDRVLNSTEVGYLYRDGTPVAHWKLNETSGSTAADSSGLSNTGTVTGTSSWTSAVRNNGFSFNGSTKIETSGLMGKSRDVSLAAWADLAAAESGGAEVISLGDHFFLRLDEGGYAKVILYNGSSWVALVTNQTFAGTGWHHYAAVFDDGNNSISLYVDGVLAASGSTTASISYSGLGSNTVIGRHGNGQTNSDFTGVIDDVRVYIHALSAEEVGELYGLVGHWKLAETSGTTAADSTVFAKNGTVNGGTNWSSDCGGNGVFDFNGSSRYISIANASHLQPTESLTIAAWINGDAWSSSDNVDVILRKGEDNPNNYQLAVADGKLELNLDNNDSAGVESATTLSTGTWYHVAATWDGTTVRIYINGALNSTAARSGTIATDSRPLYIGGRSGTDFFDGMIRDVRLYNRALPADEIAMLAGTAGRWKFSEGSGTLAADSSGAGNNATLSGGASWTTDCAGNQNALLTDGAGGIAQTATAFTPPDVGTVAFWMRSNGNPPALGRIFGLGGDWEARQETDGTVVFDLCGDGGADFYTTVPLNEVGRWYHVAVTFNSGTDTYAVYIDGQLDKSGTNSNSMSQQAAAILSFGTRTGSTQYWQGALRDFRIYRRQLCPTEITVLYGLVGHWKLDETAGATAIDSSPLANDGTYQGSPTLGVGGAVDTAVQFDGTNFAITDQTFDPPSTGTVAYWMRRAGAPAGRERHLGVNGNWEIWQDPDGIIRCDLGGDGDNGGFESVTSMVTSNKWYHIAATFDADADSFAIYVDGELDVSGNMSLNPQSAAQLSIAARTGNSTERFQGRLDDVRIYNRVLCPNEIQQLYGGGVFQGVRIINWVEVQ